VKRSQLAVVLLALAAAAVAAGVAPAAAGDPDRPPRDKRAPDLEISVTPEVLAHPNGRFRSVEIAGEVSDDDELEGVYLASVESSDPGDDRDILGARIGSFDDEVLLRAQRSATGERRVYRITYVAIDAAGNEARASATVVVSGRE
jgi:hypothetical protein